MTQTDSLFDSTTLDMANARLRPLMGDTKKLTITPYGIFKGNLPSGSQRELMQMYQNPPTPAQIERDRPMMELARELAARLPDGYNLVIDEGCVGFTNAAPRGAELMEAVVRSALGRVNTRRTGSVGQAAAL